MDMKTAMVSAGFKAPTQMETVWRAVKEMQPVGYEAIARRTGIKSSGVSSILSDMEKRGMVYSRGARGKGPAGKSKEYLTDADTYVRLSPIGTVTKPVAPATAAPATQARMPAQEQIDVLTVAQARELWVILNRMFGEKK